MAIVEITKKRVIEILKKEKLTQGTYAYSENRGARVRNRGCSFCAVGTIVRSCVATDTVLEPTVWEIARKHGVDGSGYGGSGALRGVEGAFESGGDAEEGRSRAIAWARKHLPATVQVDIGNAKPRRGMKVVG